LILTFFDIIGRFHTLLVHLPIGILLVAVFFYFLSSKEKFGALKSAVNVLLLLGAIAAVLSCISGFLLSQNGEYESNTVSIHQWLGIALAVLTIITYMVAKKEKPFTKYLMIIVALLIGVTGHLGGTLTHGEGYLTKSSSTKNNIVLKPIRNVQQALVYADVIQPILQTKCYSCHNASKQKGKLRLDDPNYILQGGEHGKTIVPNNVTESELIKRILLSDDNDDHMPPLSKPQLSKLQIDLLQWWVANGATFSKNVHEFRQHETVKKHLVSLQQLDISDVNTTATTQVATNIEKAPDSLILRLSALGVSISPIAKGSNFLAINFAAVNSVLPQHLALLGALSKQIVSLKIGGTSLTDEQLAIIAKLSNLNQLSLEKTQITNRGLAQLNTLSLLDILNVSQTKINAEGLKNLSGLKNLKKLFLFGNGISVASYNLLQKQFVNVIIDTGGYKLQSLASDTMLVKAKK
jgi:uncharacterized membrane protein